MATSSLSRLCRVLLSFFSGTRGSSFRCSIFPAWREPVARKVAKDRKDRKVHRSQSMKPLLAPSAAHTLSCLRFIFTSQNHDRSTRTGWVVFLGLGNLRGLYHGSHRLPRALLIRRRQGRR